MNTNPRCPICGNKNWMKYIVRRRQFYCRKPGCKTRFNHAGKILSTQMAIPIAPEITGEPAGMRVLHRTLF